MVEAVADAPMDVVKQANAPPVQVGAVKVVVAAILVPMTQQVNEPVVKFAVVKVVAVKVVAVKGPVVEQ